MIFSMEPVSGDSQKIMESSMRVSVVIVTRNRGQLLQRAIDSVIAQDYRPIELVIVDNASDARPAIDAGDLAVTRHRNTSMLSASKNRNIGISLSTGEFVCFLDDDDIYLPGKISRLVALMGSHHVAYGNTRMQGPGGESMGICAGPPDLPSLMLWRYLHLNALMVRRSVLQSIRFDEDMTTYEDVDFVFRLLRSHRAAHCDDVLAVWHRDGRPDQLTARNWGRARANWLILCERFSPEINAHPMLARLYYRKMFLLAALRFQPFEALRFFTRFMRFGVMA